MSKKRWFRFHIDRWFKGTTGLKPNEIAAYLTVICELYDNEGFVRLDCDVMARRCGMRPTSFQKAIDALVMRGKLDIQSGFLTNKMVSEEIIERAKLGEKSIKSRSKVDQKSPKNPMKTGEDANFYPHKQNTENKKNIDLASITEGDCGNRQAATPQHIIDFRKRMERRGR